MSLRNDAHTLCNALQGVVESLARCDSDQGEGNVQRIHADLSPKAAAFQKAVLEDRDRVMASAVLLEIAPLMTALAATTEKGVISVPGCNSNLQAYRHLEGIFQHSRFRNSFL